MVAKVKGMEISVIFKDTVDTCPLTYPGSYINNGVRTQVKDDNYFANYTPEYYIKKAFNEDTAFCAEISDEVLINKILEICTPKNDTIEACSTIYISDVDQLKRFYPCLINNSHADPEDASDFYEIYTYGKRWLSWVKSEKTRLNMACEPEDYANHVIVILC